MRKEADEGEEKNLGRKDGRKERKEANKGDVEKKQRGEWRSLYPGGGRAHIFSRSQKCGGGEAS